MDIGISQIANIVVASSTSYLVTFSPVFLLIGGLVLAMAIGYALLGIFVKGAAFGDSDVPDYMDID